MPTEILWEKLIQFGRIRLQMVDSINIYLIETGRIILIRIGKCDVKVKCTLVQALRLCTGRKAHRESRGIALL